MQQSISLVMPQTNYVNGEVLVVDGGSWHIGHGLGKGLEYPDFLLSGEDVTNVMGLKRKSQL